MSLRPETELGWLPTHVQVTILQARGLRAKGKHGTSDAFTLIQMGREKYSTSVVEKTSGAPEWKEECSFELSPGAIERGENCDLKLIVMHRALIGMDQFLGQVSVPLHGVFQEGRSQRNQWYKLHSKSGKKEKERGEIQVSIQFTRNNLTASMFDLSIKEKSKSPFGKLKDKMKVKKHLHMESSSAIVPSSVGRLDSDDEDEKKPKFKPAAFFKGLRRSSLTKSNTSLGSDSTISSTSGTIPTSAGISIVLPDVVKKPAARNSSLSTEPSVNDYEASPRMTHKRAFSDEVSQLKIVAEPKAVEKLKPKNSPISKSSLCINGSHVYTEVPLPKPPLFLEKSTPASKSFQNIVKKADEVTVPERMGGPFLSSEKQGHKPTAGLSLSAEEEKVVSKAASQKPKNDQVLVDAKPIQITPPIVFTAEVPKIKGQEVKTKDERAKVGVQHGTGKSELGYKGPTEPAPQVPSNSEERGKVGSWFGSKDAKETPPKPSFPSGSIGTTEAAEKGSSLVEEHSPLAPTSKEVQKVYTYREEKFLEDSSSLGAPVAASKLEEQFDAFASSRLKPTHKSQRPPEPKENSSSEDKSVFPLSSLDQMTDMESRNYTPYNRHFTKPDLQMLDTCWSESPDTDTRKTEDIYPLPEILSYKLSPPGIPPVESIRIQTLPTDLTTDKFITDVPDQSEPATLIVALTTPETKASTHTEANGIPIRIAAITPRVVTDQTMTSLDETLSVSLSKQGSPTQRKHPTGMIIVDESPPELAEECRSPLEIIESSLVEDMPSSVDLRQRASMENNIVSVGSALCDKVKCDEEALVEERVKGLIIEQVISENLGFVAPPKPPRLMLSPALVRMETHDDDNYKQTGNQDATDKQVESPEECVQQQNMGDSKQMVSPVAFCPVIGMQSPVLDSVSEDTQSTTEGLLTNLGEKNNDVSKLGATNGEHLLDAGDITASEQFRTCPSSVSLDTDLSSLQETSHKLPLIKHGPSGLLSTSGLSKTEKEVFNFRKPMPLPKKKNESRPESMSKKGNQSDAVFWSALEETLPSGVVDPESTKQQFSISRCTNVVLGCKDSSSQDSELGFGQSEQESLGRSMVESSVPPLNVLSEQKLESSINAVREESQQSSWSADIVVDFKNEDFWRLEPGQLDTDHGKTIPSPGNPFTPADTSYLSHRNPFIEQSRDSQSSESSLPEDMSFKDLHAQAALGHLRNALLPADVIDPFMHGSQPLAFSTPSLAAAPNPKLSNFPSPITFSTTSGVTTTTNTPADSLSRHHSVASDGAAYVPSVLPQETQTADNPFMPLRTSPHPVKPISAPPSESSAEKKTPRPALSTALTSGLEMLKSVTSGQHSATKKAEHERLKDLHPPDVAAKYYHLTHDELIHLLLQREAELGKKEEHVQELENYIDALLVRIMDKAPALLQAPLETKK